jgi:GGDEF domain-containing protein
MVFMRSRSSGSTCAPVHATRAEAADHRRPRLLAIANAELHAQMACRDPRPADRPLQPTLPRRGAGAPRWPHANRLDAERRPVAAILFDLTTSATSTRSTANRRRLVLRTFASILQNRFRASDIVARFGGEEFLVFLDGASLSEAAKIADDIRRELQAMPIPLDGGGKVYATVSAGCSAVGPQVSSMESLLQVADVGLQMAKRAGRNQIVAA